MCDWLPTGPLNSTTFGFICGGIPKGISIYIPLDLLLAIMTMEIVGAAVRVW